jgi:penicillin amidase
MATTSSLHSTPTRGTQYRRIALRAVIGFFVVLLLAVVGARLWLRHTVRAALPQIDGTLSVSGLSAPVHVQRDAQGVPHIVAANLDDLIYAQGFVTAQDRLWQMDMLRRHVTGRLAEVLGSGLVEHDRTQRYLQLRQAAERNFPLLPDEQRHFFQRYADGVNAEIAVSLNHLPPEFRLLGYKPEPWSAVDSLLVGYAMVQDLSTDYPDKFNREAVEVRLPNDLQGDLYPVGSFRDHPPREGKPDLTKPRPIANKDEDDDSEIALTSPQHVHDLLQQRQVLAASVSALRCDTCSAGSNNWTISGAHTRSGKPIVSNDPHLSLTVPGIWYKAELESGNFHVAGTSVPGIPFIIIGHNDHVAWGFTNSMADVQDLYIESITNGLYRDESGTQHPLLSQHETIRVKHGRNIDFDVMLTQHGGTLTPILSPLYPGEKRNIALRWAIYDAAASGVPFHQVNAATTGAELVQAFGGFGAPAQNLVWGDDAGHIGYHLVGQVPLRGPQGQSGLASVPVNTGSYEWTGYIPYNELPAELDPAGGVLATANARVAPADYPYGIALNWLAPYRNERIWKLLSDQTGMTVADSLAVQNDTFSALDKLYAEKIAYAVDHAKAPSKRDRQAADILRSWDGHVTANSAAASITDATRRALLPILLQPRLHDAWQLYSWGESSYALELLLEHTPERWLPSQYADWNELLTAALENGMHESSAPADLKTWTWGSRHTLDLKHPVFGASRFLHVLSGAPETGDQPMSGNGFTVRAFNGTHSASMRFTTDLADPAHSTLSLPMGESGNPASPWFMDEWPTWFAGKPQPLTTDSATHILVLAP